MYCSSLKCWTTIWKQFGLETMKHKGRFLQIDKYFKQRETRFKAQYWQRYLTCQTDCHAHHTRSTHLGRSALWVWWLASHSQSRWAGRHYPPGWSKGSSIVCLCLEAREIKATLLFVKEQRDIIIIIIWDITGAPKSLKAVMKERFYLCWTWGSLSWQCFCRKHLLFSVW